MEKMKKIPVPPIALVIVGAVIAVIAAVVVISTISANYDNYNFKAYADATTAKCIGVTHYTAEENGSNVKYFTVNLKYKANLNDVISSFVDTEPSLENLDVGDDVVIYFNRQDVYNVRPAYQFKSHAGEYIFFGLLFAGGAALFVYNLKTILRSRVPYAKTLVHENDVTEMYSDGKTDPYADIGLSDRSIDYSSQNDHTTDGTESYSDPFAVYTGYNDSEQQQAAPGQYFDPNAGYTPEMQQQESISGQSQDDINNPFVTQVNNDPNSFYNQGSYSDAAVQKQYSTMPEQPPTAPSGQYYDPGSSYNLGHYADDPNGFAGNQ